ncbi:MAG: hypothetical protein IH873_11405 [Chloroflexi bacterium]|nr:hypothetical protein [Chloroflexota bacterium]
MAKQELDTLIQLAQSEFTLDRLELAAYSEQVGAVLNRIDSNPAVLESFKNLLEEMLGVTFVFEDATSLNREPPAKVGLALPVFAPSRSSRGPFKCASVDPNYEPYFDSKAWLLLRCFMDALTDATATTSLVLMVDPSIAKAVGTVSVRRRISNRCYGDIDRCTNGNDPVFNKFLQGDMVGAHKTFRELEPKPRVRLTPTETPVQAPTPVVPTLIPTPTATLPPPIAADPTRTPTPAPVISKFSGTWIGRYTGIYHHKFDICIGVTLPIEGPLTVVLVETTTQVHVTATLGGSNVEQISQDSRDGSCSIEKASDEEFKGVATVSGDTLTILPGLQVTFTMTKTSENSAEGTTKDPYLDATFFVGRLR